MKVTNSLKISFGVFLYTGTTLPTFSIVGKISVENEMLKISANWLEISLLSDFNIFIGMLLGPTDLSELRKDTFCFSDVLVGLKKKFWGKTKINWKKNMWKVVNRLNWVPTILYNSSYNSCAAFGCTNWSSTTSLQFFHIPLAKQYPEQRIKWVTSCQERKMAG